MCSGDRSRGRNEVSDAAREGHDKGRGIVDDASDQVSSIAHGIRDKVPWHDHLTSASVAAIFKGMQLGRMPVGMALLMASCGAVSLSVLLLWVRVCQLPGISQLLCHLVVHPELSNVCSACETTPEACCCSTDRHRPDR